ncbi:lasso RiPP family leader peptide-containing protein [Cereibacter changlensis]|uniref:Lasso RiPP family leader peptide-containing protein n=1 Tax=Cereibacter changlensis TaxID=402884 RepID=A0A4V5NL47_9RHOB|nr:lasso RiPP family leader peptide-containing protein [Cereibacter changlensis]TKA94277.1 lasso RiPP family leader peptide-containing protein [Cereibacter changlensis]
MQNTSANVSYEAPKLNVHGSLEDMTQGSSVGNSLDASFPVGTPRGDLTFS